MKSLLNKLFGLGEKAIESKLSPSEKAFIDTLLFKSLEASESSYGAVTFSVLDEYLEYKKKSSTFKRETFFYLFELYKNGFGANPGSYTFSDWTQKNAIINLMSLTLRMKDLGLSVQDLTDIGKMFKDNTKHVFAFPFNPLLSRLEKHAEQGLTPEIKQCIKILWFKDDGWTGADEVKFNKRLDKLLRGTNDFGITASDLVGKTILLNLKSINKTEADKLLILLELLQKSGKGSAPTKTWLKKAVEQIKNQNQEELANHFVNWINATVEVLKKIHKEKPQYIVFLADENIDLMRGVVWVSTLINNDKLNQSVEELGLHCFKKLSGHGAISVKLGNACVFAFSELPYLDGITRLTTFRMKIKYPSVRTQIEKAIRNVAKAEGKSVNEIEELAVQDYGFDSNFKLEQKFGEYQAMIQLESGNSVVLSWQKDQGKLLKTVPKAVKDNFPEELKETKRLVKEIGTSLVTQKLRIESMFLDKREWDLKQWMGLYLEHNFLAYFGKRLIGIFAMPMAKNLLHCGAIVNG